MDMEGIKQAKIRLGEIEEKKADANYDKEALDSGVAPNYLKDPVNFKPNGQFAPGNNFGTKNNDRYSAKRNLAKAIKEVEQEDCWDMMKHFVRRSKKSDPVLIALVKKFVPDVNLSELTGESGEPIQIQIIRKVVTKPKEEEDAQSN